MSGLGTILAGAGVLERRSTGAVSSFLGAPSGDLESALLGGNRSRRGRAVTPESALRIGTVYAAVRILSEAVRICPLQVMVPDSTGRLSADPDNRLAYMMSVAPNPEIPASEMWEILVGHLCIHGNAFIFKERDAFGTVVRLWPLLPQQVMVGRLNRQKVYALMPWAVAGTPPYDMPPIGTNEDIIHLRWFGVNGLVGLSPIRQLQEDIAAEQGQTEYSQDVFANNARPGGVLQADGEITIPAANRLLARWRAAHEGHAGKVAVLEGGVKWQQTTMSLVDAQFLGQRKMSVQTIARGWRIPPGMFMADTGGGSLTYNTTELEGRHFIAYTLAPILSRVTGPLCADPDFQIVSGLRFAHDTDAILNVSTLDRIRGTALLTTAGVLSRNDGREREGLGRVAGLDTYQNPDIKARLAGQLEDDEIRELLLSAIGTPAANAPGDPTTTEPEGDD